MRFAGIVRAFIPILCVGSLLVAQVGCATAKRDRPAEAKARESSAPAARKNVATNAVTNGSHKVNGTEKSARTNATPVKTETVRSDRSVTNPVEVTLRPGLVLNISVMIAGRPELNELAKRISSSGVISLPLIGNVKAEGETVESFGRKLTQAFSEYYVSPQVIVEYVQDDATGGGSPWGYVTVLGRIKSPGRIPLPPTRDLTVSVAVQNAGGFDTSAKDSAIRVTRRNPDGTTRSIDVDLRAVGTKGEVQNDIILQSGDVVFVPEMLF